MVETGSMRLLAIAIVIVSAVPATSQLRRYPGAACSVTNTHRAFPTGFGDIADPNGNWFVCPVLMDDNTFSSNNRAFDSAEMQIYTFSTLDDFTCTAYAVSSISPYSNYFFQSNRSTSGAWNAS